MTHSTENKLVKQTQQFGWSNILTVICMAGCCYAYADNRYNKLIERLNANDRGNAVISSGMVEHERRIVDIERFREKLSIYYDKPKGIKIVIQNN
jgi:hypothetical protein